MFLDDKAPRETLDVLPFNVHIYALSFLHKAPYINGQPEDVMSLPQEKDSDEMLSSQARG